MKFFVIVIIGIITLYASAFSDLECTRECTIQSTPWTAGTPIVIEMNEPECKITIEYEWRKCDYTYEYRYTNFEAVGNCTQMANFSKEHYDISSVLEMADMIIAEESNDLDGHANLNQLPYCSQGIYRKAKFYSARCGVWVKCSYIIDQNAEVKKDRGYVGSCELADQDGYIHKWKWQSCGESCCRREYDICSYISPVNGEFEVRVTQYPAEPLGECTLQDNFGPWEITDPLDPNYNYECNDACNN